jgi:hypothetical protein
MKLPDDLHNKQISTTLTADVYEKWIAACKLENKSSFLMLRTVIEALLNTTTTSEEIGS